MLLSDLESGGPGAVPALAELCSRDSLEPLGAAPLVNLIRRGVSLAEFDRATDPTVVRDLLSPLVARLPAQMLAEHAKAKQVIKSCDWILRSGDLASSLWPPLPAVAQAVLRRSPPSIMMLLTQSRRPTRRDFIRGCNPFGKNFAAPSPMGF
jgi:hypothetical protein